MIDPNKPAFPYAAEWGYEPGLTIRAELAARFMAPIMAYAFSSEIPHLFQTAAKDAIAAADELIKQLNETT